MTLASWVLAVMVLPCATAEHSRRLLAAAQLVMHPSPGMQPWYAMRAAALLEWVIKVV